MNILVVIKGQLRTWQYNYKHLNEFVNTTLTKTRLSDSLDEPCFKNSSVDILLSHWDLSYQIYPDCYSVDYLAKEDSDFKDEIALFKSSSFVHEFYVHRENYLAAYEKFSRLQFELPSDYHMQCYLTYKTGLAKRSLEIVNKKSYDIILEIRPDVFYGHKTVTNVLPRRPLFGEVFSFDGQFVCSIGGLAAASTQDLIFLMSGSTYNIYSKEFLYHYENFKTSVQFSAIPFEKCFFFNKKNLILGSLYSSLCWSPAVIRPTAHIKKLEALDTDEKILNYLKSLDGDWMGLKDKGLKNLLLEHGDKLSEFANNKKIENQKKIAELLGYSGAAK